MKILLFLCFSLYGDFGLGSKEPQGHVQLENLLILMSSIEMGSRIYLRVTGPDLNPVPSAKSAVSVCFFVLRRMLCVLARFTTRLESNGFCAYFISPRVNCYILVHLIWFTSFGLQIGVWAAGNIVNCSTCFFLHASWTTKPKYHITWKISPVGGDCFRFFFYFPTDTVKEFPGPNSLAGVTICANSQGAWPERGLVHMGVPLYPTIWQIDRQWRSICSFALQNISIEVYNCCYVQYSLPPFTSAILMPHIQERNVYRALEFFWRTIWAIQISLWS